MSLHLLVRAPARVSASSRPASGCKRAIAWLPPLLAAAALAGCGEIHDPYPAALPHNLTITATPEYGARLQPADVEDVVLEFDRAMERASLQSVQRVSFLLPLALRSFDGRWDAGDTRITFDLDEFPIQPGATYEARFIGLRSAEGELYNGGPYEVRFRTFGRPEYFPVQPHARVATRILCRRLDGTGDCIAVTMRLEASGADTLQSRTACEDCTGARIDWFRRAAAHVEWLGWDDVDAGEVTIRSVRWPQPPRLLAQATVRGTVLEAVAQTASGGEQLESWRSEHTGSGSPVSNVEIEGKVVEVAYTGSAIVDIGYAWRDRDGMLETRHERWWLYPGVGLVRREATVARDDGTPAVHTVDLLQPSLLNFVH